MKGTGGGGTTRLADAGAGGPIDLSLYGPGADASTFQPFWDDVGFYTDEAGKTFVCGIDGDVNSSNPWDVVKLQGVALPGIWKATASPSIILDVQKPDGFDGAALVSRGYAPGHITITGQIWSPGQWAEFQRQLPTWWARPNSYAVNDRKRQRGQIQGSQKAVAVEYPGLAALGIHALVIQQVTPPEPTSDKGVCEIKMTAVEYVPEPLKKKGATKKTVGVAQVDRTVQHQRIAAEKSAREQEDVAALKEIANGGGKAMVPGSMTNPVPPSLGQTGPKLARRPAYANH